MSIYSVVWKIKKCKHALLIDHYFRLMGLIVINLMSSKRWLTSSK